MTILFKLYGWVLMKILFKLYGRGLTLSETSGTEYISECCIQIRLVKYISDTNPTGKPIVPLWRVRAMCAKKSRSCVFSVCELNKLYGWVLMVKK